MKIVMSISSLRFSKFILLKCFKYHFTFYLFQEQFKKNFINFTLSQNSMGFWGFGVLGVFGGFSIFVFSVGTPLFQNAVAPIGFLAKNQSG